MKKTILFGVALFLFTSCTTSNETGKKDAASAKKETKQTIQVISGGELATLDSAFYSDVYSSDMIGQTSEGLYRLDKNQFPELGMAQAEPTVSEDGLTYTFTLKDDATWSNGDPVRASDFVYAFSQVIDPEYGSSSSNQMDLFKHGRAIREGEAELSDFGVKALDDKTLEMTLEYPVPYLSQVLVGTPFMPKHEAFAIEKGKEYGTSSEAYSGNGPFVIEGWDGMNDTWKLLKNETYWDKENVALDEIDVQVIKEVATGTQLFETGETDYAILADSYAVEFKDSPQATFVPKAMIGYLSPNHERKITGNVNVRKAMMLAIDKAQFATEVLGDGSLPLNGYVPENFAKSPQGKDFRKENGELQPYNLEQATNFWNKAKEELGQEEIELEILSADSGSSKKTIEFLQGQLEETLPGLSIKLKSIPLQNRLELQRSGEFDLVFGTWTPDYADPVNFLEFYDSKGGLNTAKYNNPDYDKGLYDIKYTLAEDPEKRWEKMKEIEKILIEEDAGTIPIYQGAAGYLKSDRLDGLQVLPFGRSISYRLAYIN